MTKYQNINDIHLYFIMSVTSASLGFYFFSFEFKKLLLSTGAVIPLSVWGALYLLPSEKLIITEYIRILKWFFIAFVIIFELYVVSKIISNFIAKLRSGRSTDESLNLMLKKSGLPAFAQEILKFELLSIWTLFVITGLVKDYDRELLKGKFQVGSNFYWPIIIISIIMIVVFILAIEIAIGGALAYVISFFIIYTLSIFLMHIVRIFRYGISFKAKKMIISLGSFGFLSLMPEEYETKLQIDNKTEKGYILIPQSNLKEKK